MEFLIGIGLAILANTSYLWYKIGKLASEVKNHNLKLVEIEKQLEKLITGGKDV